MLDASVRKHDPVPHMNPLSFAHHEPGAVDSCDCFLSFLQSKESSQSVCNQLHSAAGLKSEYHLDKLHTDQNSCIQFD